MFWTMVPRAARIKKVEAAQKKDVSISGTYKTTADLNLRAGAGTTKDILVTIRRGQRSPVMDIIVRIKESLGIM